MFDIQGEWLNDDFFVSLDGFFDVVSTFAFYVTIALAIAMIVVVIVKSIKKQSLENLGKVYVGIAVGYSVSVIAILGYIKLLHYVVEDKINTKFWLVTALLAFILISVVVSVILSKNKSKAFKPFVITAICVAVVYGVVLVCAIPAKSESYEPLSNVGMIVATALFVVVVVTLNVLFGKKSEYDSRALTYGAMCVALSYALSYIKFFSLPQGGSVTFASLLPLMLYSYMFGIRRGTITAVVYGLLQFIQSPQFYQPMQVLIDYPLAFGAIGVTGVFRNSKLCKGIVPLEFSLGATLACSLRYVASVISGYFVFSSWAMEGYSALSWALVYNLFVFADLLVIVAVAIPLLSSKSIKRIVTTV